MAEAERRFTVTNTRVFDYQREVVVELHGRTPAGEFEVVSYAFTPDPDEETRLQGFGTVEPPHEERVRDTLGEEGYTLA